MYCKKCMLYRQRPRQKGAKLYLIHDLAICTKKIAESYVGTYYIRAQLPNNCTTLNNRFVFVMFVRYWLDEKKSQQETWLFK